MSARAPNLPHHGCPDGGRSNDQISHPPGVVFSMQIEMLPIDRLREYEANPRVCSEEAVKRLAAAIREFGFKVPVIVDRENILVAGHTRVRAARQLKLAEVPAIRADDLSDAQIQAFRVADNKLHELTEWNMELLAVELQEISSLDIDPFLLGFSNDELNELMAPPPTLGLTLADEVPEPPKTAITQPGDLWRLGPHRLLCGDSTNVEDVRRLMTGERAALFSTDPPYLVDYDGTNHPHRWNEPDKNKDWSGTYGVDWDDADANPELFDQFITVAVAEAILPNAAWYCWHASRR